MAQENLVRPSYPVRGKTQRGTTTAGAR
jgi:hypothetical protein